MQYLLVIIILSVLIWTLQAAHVINKLDVFLDLLLASPQPLRVYCKAKWRNEVATQSHAIVRIRTSHAVVGYNLPIELAC